MNRKNSTRRGGLEGTGDGATGDGDGLEGFTRGRVKESGTIAQQLFKSLQQPKSGCHKLYVWGRNVGSRIRIEQMRDHGSDLSS